MNGSNESKASALSDLLVKDLGIPQEIAGRIVAGLAPDKCEMMFERLDAMIVPFEANNCDGDTDQDKRRDASPHPPEFGVADSPEQFAARFPLHTGLVCFARVARKDQPANYGWRWHKYPPL
jgi:hypothetical protein